MGTPAALVCSIVAICTPGQRGLAIVALAVSTLESVLLICLLVTLM